MIRTPDRIDPAVGWRMWSLNPRVAQGVESGEWVLGSPFVPVDWQPGVPLVATCRFCQESPTRECSCGVYAYLTGPFVEDAPLSVGARPRRIGLVGVFMPCVIGQVAGWGRVVEHTKGWRAAKVYPLSLALICVGCLLKRALLERANMVCSSAGGPLWALCEAHIGAYPGRPRHIQACDAREAELSLTSRYGVRRAEIPDAWKAGSPQGTY